MTTFIERVLTADIRFLEKASKKGLLNLEIVSGTIFFQVTADHSSGILNDGHHAFYKINDNEAYKVGLVDMDGTRVTNIRFFVDVPEHIQKDLLKKLAASKARSRSAKAK